jgi:hypothetical protein
MLSDSLVYFFVLHSFELVSTMIFVSLWDSLLVAFSLRIKYFRFWYALAVRLGIGGKLNMLWCNLMYNWL